MTRIEAYFEVDDTEYDSTVQAIIDAGGVITNEVDL